MRQKTDGLTKKQKEVLEFIKQFHADNKYPPSIRQICSAINLSSPATVHVHINHLVDKGYIKRSKEGKKKLGERGREGERKEWRGNKGREGQG